ncbi:MAG: hypothetical protein PUP46_01675 [Endozoicomonas sp. (ex Botrylloides leachii)]|nr:hypothetical protein [Endozoicomonas sp. (ex Botrylloides leachii)]
MPEDINDIINYFNKILEKMSDRKTCQIEAYDASLGHRVAIEPEKLQDLFIESFPGNTDFAMQLCSDSMVWFMNNAEHTDKKLILPDLKRISSLILNYPESNVLINTVNKLHIKNIESAFHTFFHSYHDAYYDKGDLSLSIWVKLYEGDLSRVLPKLSDIESKISISIISNNQRRDSFEGNYFAVTEESIPPNTDLYLLQLSSGIPK